MYTLNYALCMSHNRPWVQINKPVARMWSSSCLQQSALLISELSIDNSDTVHNDVKLKTLTIIN